MSSLIKRIEDFQEYVCVKLASAYAGTENLQDKNYMSDVRSEIEKFAKEMYEAGEKDTIADLGEIQQYQNEMSSLSHETNPL